MLNFKSSRARCRLLAAGSVTAGLLLLKSRRGKTSDQHGQHRPAQ